MAYPEFSPPLQCQNKTTGFDGVPWHAETTNPNTKPSLSVAPLEDKNGKIKSKWIIQLSQVKKHRNPPFEGGRGMFHRIDKQMDNSL